MALLIWPFLISLGQYLHRLDLHTRSFCLSEVMAVGVGVGILAWTSMSFRFWLRLYPKMGDFLWTLSVATVLPRMDQLLWTMSLGGVQSGL